MHSFEGCVGGEGFCLYLCIRVWCHKKSMHIWNTSDCCNSQPGRDGCDNSVKNSQHVNGIVLTLVPALTLSSLYPSL